MKHIARQLPVSFAIAVLAVVSITGCAAPTLPVTPHTVARPTPTPTPTAAAAPGPRVPVTCANLLTTTMVAQVVGESVTVTTDKLTAPRYFADLANAQLGSLACVWSGQDGSDYGPFAQEAIYIAHDSVPAFNSNYADNMSAVPAGYSAAVENTAGTKSGYRCGSSPAADAAVEIFGCQAQMLVLSYWVSVYISAVAPSTTSTVIAGTQAILEALARQLIAAGEPCTAAWVSPTTATPAFCAGPTAAAAVEKAVQGSDFAPSPTPKPRVDAYSVALDGRAVSCTFTSITRGTIDIELLAGGSWAFPGFHPAGLFDDIVQTFAPATVPGATGVELGCNEGGCETYFSIGTTAAFVSFPDFGAAKNVTVLAALAKDFAES